MKHNPKHNSKKTKKAVNKRVVMYIVANTESRNAFIAGGRYKNGVRRR